MISHYSISGAAECSRMERMGDHSAASPPRGDAEFDLNYRCEMRSRFTNLQLLLLSLSQPLLISFVLSVEFLFKKKQSENLTK